MRYLVVLAIIACGCAGPSTKVVEPPVRAEAPPGPPEAAAPAERVVPLAGGANALLWDAASSTLYLTDNNTSSLLAWTEAGGIRTIGALPAQSAGVSLGGVVRRGDGTTVVANFGFGSQGGLFVMAADHTVTTLTGLDATRRRVGLSQDGSGAIYSAYFVGDRGKAAVGGVSTVAIDGKAASETEIAGASTSAGFGKVIGIVATPTALFVADQTQKAIWKLAVPGYAVSRVASVPAADLLAILPDGDLLTGGGPAISRITQAGQVSVLATGFEQVRGLAYDPAGQRLFVIDHSLTVGVPDKLRIQRLAR